MTASLKCLIRLSLMAFFAESRPVIPGSGKTWENASTENMYRELSELLKTIIEHHFRELMFFVATLSAVLLSWLIAKCCNACEDGKRYRKLRRSQSADD